MFEAMDFAGKLAKSSTADPTALPAREILRAATRGGAEALGLSHRIGSIEVGKRADFLLVDLAVPHAVPFRDPYSALVYTAKASDVTDVWVDGKRLLENRRCRTLDRGSILEAAQSWRRKVQESLAAPARRAS
jgi:5-methylthioadenosine/S-adenosylhomocysteine deaminase